MGGAAPLVRRGGAPSLRGCLGTRRAKPARRNGGFRSPSRACARAVRDLTESTHGGLIPLAPTPGRSEVLGSPLCAARASLGACPRNPLAKSTWRAALKGDAVAGTCARTAPLIGSLVLGQASHQIETHPGAGWVRAKRDAFRNALHGCRAERGVRAQVDGGDAAQKLSRALAYAPFSLAPSARCASCKMQQRRYIVSDSGTAPEALLAEKRPRVLQLQSRMEVSRRLLRSCTCSSHGLLTRRSRRTRFNWSKAKCSIILTHESQSACLLRKKIFTVALGIAWRSPAGTRWRKSASVSKREPCKRTHKARD